MGDDDGSGTYNPEYADLPTKDTSGFIRESPPPLCPECDAWGEVEKNIAIKDGDLYALFRVWGCRECGHYWKTKQRPLSTLFSHKTENPEALGYEIVKDE